MKPLYETLGRTPKDEFIRACLTDFKYFVEHVLTLKCEPYHIEWAQNFYNCQRSAICAFRGSGKSTMMGVAFPLWLMAFDQISRKQPNRRDKPLKIMIVSPTIKQSKKILKEAKDYIINVEFLNQLLYPDMTWRTGLMWTKTEIETKNKCQMFCQPYTENMRSEHVNYILVDECSLLRDLQIYDKACIPMASVPPGNICLIGTPMTEYDLLARSQLPNSGYKISKYPATTQGRPTWEWRYDSKNLEQKRKELGELGYAREYLCEVTSETSQAISSQSIIRCINPLLRLRTDLTNPNEQIKDTIGLPLRVTGIDLAMSATGDYSVSTTLKQTIGGQWLIEHLDRKRGMGSEAHREWIKTIYHGLRPIKMNIDKSQFGDYLINDLKASGVICDPYKFGYDTRKEAIGAVIGMFEGKRIIIPRDPNDPLTMQLTDQLIHELAALIPTKTNTGLDTYKTTTLHDDMVMSLSLAVAAIPQGQTTGFYMRTWDDEEKTIQY